MTFDKQMFISMTQQWHKFQTITSHTMFSKKTGTIFIYMSTDQEVEISGVLYISDCTSNLLSLSQLKEIKISYNNRSNDMILKRGDKEVAWAKWGRQLFILKSIIGSKLLMLASAHKRPTYLKASTDIRQLWHRRLRNASHTRIKYLTNMVDRIQLDCAHLLKDDNISELNQSDEILSHSLLKQHLTASPLSTLLRASPELVIVASTNRPVCKTCVFSKQTWMIGHKPITLTTKPLQRAFSDLWGPRDPAFIGGNCYFVVIIDDNTRKVWTYGITIKDMFFSVFKMWKKGVKTETELKLSSLQIDDGGKYISLGLKKFCEEKKVVIEFTSLYIPKQNSIAKWSWRIFDTIKDAILANSKLPKEFWAEAMATTEYLKNLLPTSSKEKVPKKLWTSKRQDVGYLVVFGCLAYVKILKKKRKKSQQKIWKSIMIGYT